MCPHAASPLYRRGSGVVSQPAAVEVWVGVGRTGPGNLFRLTLLHYSCGHGLQRQQDPTKAVISQGGRAAAPRASSPAEGPAPAEPTDPLEESDCNPEESVSACTRV